MFSSYIKHICCSCILWISFACFSQQVADTISLVPEIKNPNFKLGNGPTVYIDELHHNFHTKAGRFKPFCSLLEKDGYRVKSLKDYENLNTTDILVISNALNSKNIGNWQQPIYDAFKAEEIKRLKTWVTQGGRLLIIADHMPFSGATNSLANAFGFDFCDGFAQLTKEGNQPDIFSEENKRLIPSQLTNGSIGNSIQSITTFTGSSFQIPPNAIGILKFLKGDECLQPQIAWQFDDQTQAKDLTDSYQGAIMDFGKGKLSVFGEAAQFTAQQVTNNDGTFSIGFNSDDAPNNIDFIRNLMFWLGTE
ncbi:hypothetical protein [Psychroserpens sp. MEBiC05023]